MNIFYKILDDFKTILNAEPQINTVSYGDIFDVDLTKQAIFPLAHITPGNATIDDRVITMDMSVILMDIVDISKEDVTDNFIGIDNEQDILNMQLAIAARFTAIIKKNDLYTNEYEIVGSVNCENFTERFENNMAGWTLTFSVQTKNDMTAC
mgnify:FL=1|tara:strand:+ start:79 stop:534 length:456 start_codon:yes stop_codon:yes gene_type:complete